MLKVVVCPAITVPLCDLEIVSSGTMPRRLTSASVLFSGVSSPPPETVAVLMMSRGASGATLTVRVIGGKFAPGARVPVRVQVVVGPNAQVHPSPDAAVAVREAGSGSVTVTVPVDWPAAAAFETRML
jgi:hypothetical protein